MNEIRKLISTLSGLLALVALGLGLVWLLGPQGALPAPAALPTQRVSPVQTPTPPKQPTPTPGMVKTRTPEVINFITPPPTYVPPPTPTPHPWPETKPFPIPGPAEDPSGTILYITYDDSGDREHRECTVHAIEVDKTGRPISEPKALTSMENCSGASVSPDGRYLAIPQGTPQGMERLFILDLESGRTWPVFDPEGPVEGFFHDWHPDSRHILFSSDYTLDAGLWLVDIETGEYSVLAGLGWAANGGAAASPDGTRVLYADGDEVWVISLDGTKRERLDAPIGYVRGWSPDGKWILSTGGGVYATNVLDGRHIQLDPDFASRQEGSLPPVPGNAILSNRLAAWSPDGRTVAATQMMVPKGGDADFNPFKAGNTYLMDASGGRKWPLLLEGAGLSAAWSPDGSMLAFLSDRSGTHEVWVANADGADLHQLTREGPARQFSIHYAPIWISSRR